MANKNVLSVFVILATILAAVSVYAALAPTSPIETDSVTFGCYDSDNGVYPYVKGYCVDHENFRYYDHGVNPTNKYPGGTYAMEFFCMTTEMRDYCKTKNTAAYCDGLADNCYGLPLLPPWEFNNEWTYFPFDTKYLCTLGFSNGKCNVLICDSSGKCNFPVCGDKIINDVESCDGTLLGGKTCSTASYGKYSGGTLSCTSSCKFDFSKCTTGIPWSN